MCTNTIITPAIKISSSGDRKRQLAFYLIFISIALRLPQRQELMSEGTEMCRRCYHKQPIVTIRGYRIRLKTVRVPNVNRIVYNNTDLILQR